MSDSRPILFSDPMVRAILAGQKTQTRQVVSDRTSVGRSLASDLDMDSFRTWVNFGVLPITEQRCAWLHIPGHAVLGREPEFFELYPRVKEGDRLWVREAWRLSGASRPGAEQGVLYRAGGEGADSDQWRPSIHMPRWASRLELEVTRVFPQRLHDISPEDIRAEGVGSSMTSDDELREEFAVLWDGTNVCRAPWASNPWVWGYEWAPLAAEGS